MKKKSQKKYNPNKGLLYNLKYQILKSKDVSEVFAVARSVLSKEQYPLLLQEIKHTAYGQKKFGAPFPKDVNSLYQSLPLYLVEVEKELEWIKAYLSSSCDQLNKFIVLSQEFERLYLIGENAKAESILENLGNEFGQSLWLIKNKLAFYQNVYGLEKQKEFTKKIINESSEIGLLSWIVDRFSVALEPATSFQKFATNIKSMIENASPGNPGALFIKFHLLGQYQLSESDCLALLSFEAYNTAIDLYETAINILQILVSTGKTTIADGLLNSLTKAGLRDKRITAVSNLHNNASPILFEDAEMYADFVTGNVNSAYTRAKSYLVNKSDNFAVVDIAARAAAIGDIETQESKVPVDKIIHSLKNTMLLNDPEAMHGKTILKLCLSFPLQSWSRFAIGILMRQHSSVPNDSIGELVPIGINSLPYDNINSIRYTSRSQREQICASISKLPSLNILPIECLSEDKCCEDCDQTNRELIYMCMCKMVSMQQFGKCIIHAESLIGSGVRYYQVRGHKLKVYSLLQLGHVIECCDYVSKISTSDATLLPIIPVTEICAQITKEILAANKHKISIPIMYELATQTTGESMEKFKRYALEDFLSSQQVLKASELPLECDQYTKDEIIFFFTHLCTDTNMDLLFGSSEEVARERADICKILSEIDSSNIDQYQSEIKKIHKELHIKNKTREVEKTKIFVDVTNLKQIAKNDYKEQFERYKSYLKDGLDESVFEYSEKSKATFSTSAETGIKLDDVMKNEMRAIMETLVVGLRDLFVFNHEHGLDTYLSVRIRHGTFMSKLRGPLESEYLITRTDEVSGTYKPNTFMYKKLGIDDPEDRKAFDKIMNRFANDYDSLLTNIKDRWIHATTDGKGPGLIDFTIYTDHVEFLSKSITISTTFDEFVDTTFEFFYKMLNISLTKIRRILGHVPYTEALRLFDNLMADIKSTRANIGNRESLLRSITRAKTEVQYSFERVIEWFVLHQAVEARPFKIEDANDIAINSIKTLMPSFEITYSQDEVLEHITLLNGRLASFVDILFNLYHNIAKEAAKVTKSDAALNVTMKNKNLILTLSNQVSDSSIRTIQDKIQSIKSKIDYQENNKLLQTEGGTGLFKIKKILLRDFSLPQENRYPGFDFDLDDTGDFTIVITIPLSIVWVDNENTTH